MKNKRLLYLKKAACCAENGRSMVEMLGVLAVIGVLSIGGIWGYTYAMNYYQADNIASEINLMRNDAKVKIGQGEKRLVMGSNHESENAASLSGGKGLLRFNRYPVEYDCLSGDIKIDDCREADGYHFTLSDVSDGVCKTLATLLNGMSEKRVVKVNDEAFEQGEQCSQEYNTVAVIFDADPDLKGFNDDDFTPCDVDGDCDNGYCEEGKCFIECEHNKDCGTDGTDGYCQKGLCVECLDNGNCGEYVCNKATFTCEPCQNSDQCAAGESCLNGACGHFCSDNSDCSTVTPVCDPSTGVCAACHDDGECGEAGYGHCTADGRCAVCDDNIPYFDGNQCSACPDKYFWDKSKKECVTYECRENKDCDEKGSGYYCYMKEGYQCTQEFENNPSSKYFSGTCISAQGHVRGKTGQFTMSVFGAFDTFWSSERFCAALGKRMVSLEDIECVSEQFCLAEPMNKIKNSWSGVGFWMKPKVDSCYSSNLDYDFNYKEYEGEGEVPYIPHDVKHQMHEPDVSVCVDV